MNVYLCGERRTGKSTAAAALTEAFGLREVSITTPLYEIARQYFGMTEKDRALLQKVGDAFRNVETDWLIRNVLRAAESGQGAVCADVRLPREGEVLRAAGWIGLRIERAREHQSAAILAAGESLTGEQSQHATETQVRLVPVDGVVFNRGTPEELALTVVDVVNAIARANGINAGASRQRPYSLGLAPAT